MPRDRPVSVGSYIERIVRHCLPETKSMIRGFGSFGTPCHPPGKFPTPDRRTDRRACLNGSPYVEAQRGFEEIRQQPLRPRGYRLPGTRDRLSLGLLPSYGPEGIVDSMGSRVNAPAARVSGCGELSAAGRRGPLVSAAFRMLLRGDRLQRGSAVAGPRVRAWFAFAWNAGWFLL